MYWRFTCNILASRKIHVIVSEWSLCPISFVIQHRLYHCTTLLHVIVFNSILWQDYMRYHMTYDRRKLYRDNVILTATIPTWYGASKRVWSIVWSTVRYGTTYKEYKKTIFKSLKKELCDTYNMWNNIKTTCNTKTSTRGRRIPLKHYLWIRLPIVEISVYILINTNVLPIHICMV
jgi:hypothetical protein